jgi:hypothetical protein
LRLHTGSISLFYLFVKGFGTPVPLPHKRNGALIPRLKRRGFSRARSIIHSI